MALTRSENMARIKGANTRPELALRKELTRRGLRYRLQYRIEGVRVDIAFPSRKLAVMIDGCFWHGCPEHYVHPRGNSAFWDKKLRENVDRDRRQTLKLRANGWTVVRLWEHEVLESVTRAGELVVRGTQRRVQPRVVAVEHLGTGREERWTLEELLDASRARTEQRIRNTRKLGRIRAEKETK
ncbi:MAG: very short patch repair endonuclease [Archangium gephyra]|uniref:Very short patch repair endonuclease n=1 Tax=Archangium gephyra TaxID=48 RepID=A0A2W5T595_9BACT|nr:MAG: very short patch repair endonuclease [Archangium gephyra]